MASSKGSGFWAKCVPGVLVGALTGGILGGVLSQFGSGGTQGQPVVQQLNFQPEAFDMDPDCARSFLNLQAHRHLSPALFDEAGREADSLFCLEKQLASGEVTWEHDDVFTSRRLVRSVLKHLAEFYKLAMDRLYHHRYDRYEELEHAGAEQSQIQEAHQQVEDGKEMIRQMKRSIDEIKVIMTRHEGKLARHLPSQELMLPAPVSSRGTTCLDDLAASTIAGEDDDDDDDDVRQQEDGAVSSSSSSSSPPPSPCTTVEDSNIR